MSKILSIDKICYKNLMMCKHTLIQRKMLMLFASVDQLMANILEIDLISQGYMLSVSINILCEMNLYDCCLDGQDCRAVSGPASSSDPSRSPSIDTT